LLAYNAAVNAKSNSINERLKFHVCKILGQVDRCRLEYGRDLIPRLSGKLKIQSTHSITQFNLQLKCPIVKWFRDLHIRISF